MPASLEVAERVVTAGGAYWNQRHSLAQSRERIGQLIQAVGHGNVFAPYQWAQQTALVLEFQPDCILEIGSGWGNATCAFVDAAHQIGGCRVISIDSSDSSDRRAWRGAVAPLVNGQWFDLLDCREGRFANFDYAALLADSQRVLVYWNSSGYDAAECVLGLVLPVIADRPHLVAMHGISNANFQGPEHSAYGNRPLWTTTNSGSRIRLGQIDSASLHALAITDFASRNGVNLCSADGSFHEEIAADESRVAEMQSLLGDALFSLQGHWFWFSLNDAPGPCTFPWCPESSSDSNRRNWNRASQAYLEFRRSQVAMPRFEEVPDNRLSLPAAALWQQRAKVQDSSDQLRRFHETFGREEGLSSGLLAQWLAVALEYEPDLILEVGRGGGSTTCVWTEAANRLIPRPCRVISVCDSPSWSRVAPKPFAPFVPKNWLDVLTTYSGAIENFDYEPLIGDAQRVLVFWHANGLPTAEGVLGRILPLVADRQHLVIAHDLSDARYLEAEAWDYHGRRLWRGRRDDDARIRLAHIDSASEKAVAIVDFASRNEVPLHSAAESLLGELSSVDRRVDELRKCLGTEFLPFAANWFWFTLNSQAAPATFPHVESIQPREVSDENLSPADAIWNRREILAAICARLRSLIEAVGRPAEMKPAEALQLAAMALDFEPDLILELGSAGGNATCVLTEAANHIGLDRCKVVSVSPETARERLPPAAIARVVPDEWFRPLEPYFSEIPAADYSAILSDAKRVLVFWNARGHDVAECVLGEVLPLLRDRKHIVILHGLSDARYTPSEVADYGDAELWREVGHGNASHLQIGHIESAGMHALAIVDFTSRNKLQLNSATENLHTTFSSDDPKTLELQNAFGEEMFSLDANWFWLTLNREPGPITFPRFQKIKPAPPPLGFPAASLWNQREKLATSGIRIRALHDAFTDDDLRLHEFAQLVAATLEFQPDLVLELGRNRGRSTCAFIEAVYRIEVGWSRVFSLCNEKSWNRIRPPEIASVVPENWFDRLQTRRGNILDFDYERLLSGAKRVLVYCNANGFDVAECLLGRVLPLLVDRPHLVIMPGISDSRFSRDHVAGYGDAGIWRGGPSGSARVRLGHIESATERAVAVVDFCSRNHVILNSAAECLQSELPRDLAKLQGLEHLLGTELFSTQARWFYFSLNDHPGPIAFPKPAARSAFAHWLGKESFQNRMFHNLQRVANAVRPKRK